MAPSHHHTADELVRRTAAKGFNLSGFVCGAKFDSGQPAGRRSRDFRADCGTLFLIGNGGAGFFEYLAAAGVELGEPAPDRHPIDGYSAEVCAELTRWLQTEGISARFVQPDDDPSINFMQLAEVAGWGTISPVLGLLLHPEYGPWVSTRAVLLIDGTPFGEIEAAEHPSFQPCVGCDRPCVRACPAEVYDGIGGVRLDRCAAHRHAGHCATGCDARRACPVGAAARFGPDEERFRHAYSLFSMRRHYGLR